MVEKNTYPTAQFIRYPNSLIKPLKFITKFQFTKTTTGKTPTSLNEKAVFIINLKIQLLNVWV